MSGTRGGFPDDWLRRLLRGLVRTGGLLESHHHAGLRLSLSELFALAELADAETLTQQELAERLGLEKSTVSRLATGLERREWLSRQRDPSNRRFYRLRLTPQGQHVATTVAGHFHSLHAALFDALTPAERTGLEVGLSGLIRALDTVGTSHHRQHRDRHTGRVPPTEGTLHPR